MKYLLPLKVIWWALPGGLPKKDYGFNRQTFFNYFKENLGAESFSFEVIYPWNLPSFFET